MSGKQKRWLLVAAIVAAAGLASLLALPGPVKLRAEDNEQSRAQSWTFAVVSGEAAPGTDRIILDGAGRFNAHAGEAQGSGRFTRFTSFAMPNPTVAFGTFEVTDFQSFTPTTPPTYGAHAGGVLIMTVDLHPDGQPAIRGATMKVV
jgi:hypothetical protein